MEREQKKVKAKIAMDGWSKKEHGLTEHSQKKMKRIKELKK